MTHRTYSHAKIESQTNVMPIVLAYIKENYDEKALLHLDVICDYIKFEEKSRIRILYFTNKTEKGYNITDIEMDAFDGGNKIMQKLAAEFGGVYYEI